MLNFDTTVLLSYATPVVAASIDADGDDLSRLGASRSADPLPINNNFWLKDKGFDFSGVSVYCDKNPGLGFGGTLLTPDVAIFAAHLGRTPSVGHKCRFAEDGGTVHERTITHRHLTTDNDVGLVLFDSPLPSTIAYYPLLETATAQASDDLRTFPILKMDAGQKVSLSTGRINTDNITHNGSYAVEGYESFKEPVEYGDSGNPSFFAHGSGGLIFAGAQWTYSGTGGNSAVAVQPALDALATASGRTDLMLFSLLEANFTEPEAPTIPEPTAEEIASAAEEIALESVEEIKAVILDLEEGLNSGSTAINVDGMSTTFSPESARRRIRELRNQIRTLQGKKKKSRFRQYNLG